VENWGKEREEDNEAQTLVDGGKKKVPTKPSDPSTSQLKNIPFSWRACPEKLGGKGEEKPERRSGRDAVEGKE